MKKTTILRWAPSRAQTRILILLLLCGAIGLSAQAPTTSIPPSPGLAVFDPTPVVAAFGQSSSWNAWADKAITTLGQQVQANTAAIAAIPVTSAVSQWVGVDQVKNFVHSDTGDPTTDVGLPGISDKTFIFIRPGDYLDFPLNVPIGTNALAIAVSTGGALGTYHFEFPAGTKIGATVTVPNTRNWSSYATQVVPVGSLPSGAITVRWVCETAGMNVAGVKPVKQ